MERIRGYSKGEGVEKKEGREREKGHGNDLEVEKKRRNGEEKKEE